MNKILAVMTMVCLMGISFNTRAQSLDEILEAHFEVMGYATMAEMKSVVTTAKMIQQGHDLPLVIYHLRDAERIKSRVEIEFQGSRMIIQAYDGQDGWSKMLGSNGSLEVVDLPTEQIEEMATFTLEGELYNAKKLSYEIELLGLDEFEGSAVYSLMLTKPNGSTITYYLDQDFYVLLGTKSKIKKDGQVFEVVTTYSSYELIHGTAQAMFVIQSANGAEVLNATYDKVEFNTDIDPSLFTRPAE